MKRRWMGIDYGDVRTGLAVSDGEFRSGVPVPQEEETEEETKESEAPSAALDGDGLNGYKFGARSDKGPGAVKK